MKHKNIIFDLAGVVINLNIERDTEALKSVGFGRSFLYFLLAEGKLSFLHSKVWVIDLKP